MTTYPFITAAMKSHDARLEITFGPLSDLFGSHIIGYRAVGKSIDESLCNLEKLLMANAKDEMIEEKQA